MTDVIRQSLIALSPDGSRSDVVIHIAVPVEDGDAFRCKVQLIGVDHLPAGIVGADAMQALHLGLRFIGMRLAAQEEDHGIRYFTADDPSRPFPWRMIWYGRPPESASSS